MSAKISFKNGEKYSKGLENRCPSQGNVSKMKDSLYIGEIKLFYADHVKKAFRKYTVDLSFFLRYRYRYQS